MNASRLEIVSRLPATPQHATPLLFIHGAYGGAWCWEDHFLDYFAQQGWAAHAISLSGHGDSPSTHHLDGLSIENYVDDLREAIASLERPPVLIGHSMGGFVVQKYLEQGDAPAVVLMAAVPPQGIISSMFSLMLHKPSLLLDLNSLLGGGQPPMASLREALFHQSVDERVLQNCYRRMQPESLRAIWDMSGFNLPRLDKMNRPPMLILGASHDRLIPPDSVEQTARAYDLEAEIFDDMGHAMMMEPGWQGPAERIAQWLRELDLKPSTH